MKKIRIIVISVLISVMGLSSQSLAGASWTTEWTNPDGSKSQTLATFYNRTRTDGRVGHYSLSNGRILGVLNSRVLT